MKLRNSILSRLAATTALGVGLMASAACGEDGGGLKDTVCGDYECADKGVAEGNASISGLPSLDAFFGSVVNFGKVGSSVTADIKAELDAIQVAFGISNAQLAEAKGDLSAAIKTKLENDLEAELVVDAQPAKCEVEASVQVEATAKCEVEAGCDVEGGSANIECMGTCTVEASAEGKCEGDIKATCEFSGPSLECQGQCNGSCTVTGELAATCEGTCKGECDGECSLKNADGSCNGTCEGTCGGSCELGGMAALECQGSCNGSCKLEEPEGGCSADAKVTCEFEAEAEASCTGKCEGEIVPPSVECDAKASCEASAKADAKFAAKCTPPSVKVEFRASADADAELTAKLAFIRGELEVHLPRLLAAIKKAEFVADAGVQLVDDGGAAIEGTLDALADGDVKADVAYRLTVGNCVVPQIKAAGSLVADVSKDLKDQAAAAVKVTGAVGLAGS